NCSHLRKPPTEVSSRLPHPARISKFHLKYFAILLVKMAYPSHRPPVELSFCFRQPCFPVTCSSDGDVAECWISAFPRGAVPASSLVWFRPLPKGSKD